MNTFMDNLLGSFEEFSIVEYTPKCKDFCGNNVNNVM